MAKRKKKAATATTEPKKKGKVGGARPGAGRPTLYRPEYCRLAYEMCAGEDPATDVELADALGIHVRNLIEWRHRYPDFALACKLGKSQADDRIERSLYHRAKGYEYDSEEIKVVSGKVVRVTVRIHVPPDTQAMMKWLHNRRPKDWRERVEHTGPDGGPMQHVQYVARMPENVASIDEWLQKSK